MSRAVRCEAWFVRIACTVMTAALLLGLVGPFALATAEAEEGQHEAPHEVHFGKEMVFQIINFILLILLLVYVYRRTSAGGFEKRSLQIQMAMEEAVRAKKEAEAKYLEYQSRIAQLDDEIRVIIERSMEDAEKERASIMEDARRQAEKTIQQAHLTAKHEVSLAKKELRREAAELAAELAAQALKEAMTQEDQRKWIQAYIDNIGEVQ